MQLTLGRGLWGLGPL